MGSWQHLAVPVALAPILEQRTTQQPSTPSPHLQLSDPQSSTPALTFSLESCPSSLAALKIICVPCREQRDRDSPS